jgi:hypothetical protein
MGHGMTDERHAAIQAALLLDSSNLNAIAKELHCTWRAVRDVWEGRVVGHRAVKEIVEERDALRRSVLAEKDEVRQSEIAKIRDGILADYEQRMGKLDEREAHVQRLLAEAEAAARDAEERSRRLHAARIESGRADGDNVRDQEALLCRSNRNLQAAGLNVLALTLTPTVIRNLSEGLKRDAGQTMTGKEAATYLRLVGGLAKAFAESGEITARTERLVAGAPTSITRTEVVIDPDDTAALLAAAERNAVLLAQVRGLDALEAPAEDAVLELPAKSEACQDAVPALPDDVGKASQVPVETEGEGDVGEGGQENRNEDPDPLPPHG